MEEKHLTRPEPFIPASTLLPEITLKAVLLGILLSVILAGANAYLGLFAGMTVSASIPAAVIEILGFFNWHPDCLKGVAVKVLRSKTRKISNRSKKNKERGGKHHESVRQERFHAG